MTWNIYILPQNWGWPKISVPAFADASHNKVHSRIGVLVGLLIDSITKDSIYHVVAWLLHKSKRRVESAPAVQILAASEAIDIGKEISRTSSKALGMKFGLHLLVDSKDFLNTVSTQRLFLDRSIRCDVGEIRFEPATGTVNKISRIPDHCNLADVLTITDTSLTGALQLTLSTVSSL